MIILNNQQRDILVDLAKLKAEAQLALDNLNYSDFDLSILLVTESAMHKFNKDYRQKDKSTDILSFPFHPKLKAGERIIIKSDDDKNLGDIILCPQYIFNDLERWEKSFEDRLQILLVHGIYHLLGYDHILDEDYQVMKKQEEWLLAQINKQGILI